MAATFFDLIVVLMCPLVLSAAAWGIAISALSETDEISKVVAALTGSNGTWPKGVVDKAKHADDVSRGTRYIASNVTRAKHRAMRRSFSRGADRGGISATSETAQPGVAPAVLRTALPVALSAVLAAVLAAVMAVLAMPAHAARYEFDQRRTEVRFVYKMAYSTQRGRFTKVSGTLDYDDAAPEKAKISASIATASLTTGEALVDNELKGAAFFNVEASPVIAFKSLAVQPGSATAADVSGEITVNGITKPVMLKVSLKPHDDPALKYDAGAREFIATTRIQRSAFNMTDYQSMVDDDIDIEIAAIVRPKR